MTNVRVQRNEPATVLRVIDESNLGFTGYSIWLSCGHVMPADADEANLSLVGAETICTRHFE